MHSEIIAPVPGQIPNSLIIPFRYIDPQEIADKTGGIPDGVGLSINQISYSDRDAIIYGMQETLRLRESPYWWSGERNDGLDVVFRICEAHIGLFESAVIMRPESVIFVPHRIVGVYDNVVFGIISRDEAAIVTRSRDRQLQLDPDVVKATELAAQWAPTLKEAREAIKKEANERIWRIPES